MERFFEKSVFVAGAGGLLLDDVLLRGGARDTGQLKITIGSRLMASSQSGSTCYGGEDEADAISACSFCVADGAPYAIACSRSCMCHDGDEEQTQRLTPQLGKSQFAVQTRPTMVAELLSPSRLPNGSRAAASNKAASSSALRRICGDPYI